VWGSPGFRRTRVKSTPSAEKDGMRFSQRERVYSLGAARVKRESQGFESEWGILREDGKKID